MKAKIFLVPWLLLWSSTYAQTVFWQDNFEVAGAPDVAAGSTRAAENNSGSGGPPFTSYFCRTPGTAAVAQSVVFTGITGTNYWAGEDHDTPFGVGNEEQQVEWTNINITGKTSITFRGFFAANSTNASWDNVNTGSGAAGFGPFPASSASNDYIIVEYAIGAAAYTQLIAFYSDDLAGGPGVGKKLKEDTDGNFIGDGTILTAALTEFTKSIPGTGTTMKLRIRGYSNGTNEEWGMDNFRLTGAVLPVTWSHFDLAERPEGVQLAWGTTSEVGSDFFAVERSTDGILFSEIGRIDAAQHSTASLEYAFLDGAPGIGENYYRIRQVDLNGEFTSSEAISAHVADPVAFETYPNPAQESLHIRLGKSVEAITILDLGGSAVQAPLQVSDGMATVDVSHLASGMYIARIAHVGGVALRRFVVQR